MFKINQKVVCINEERANRPLTPEDVYEYSPNVKQDEIYTIRKIHESYGLIWLHFYEKWGATWESSDFRPLDYDFVEEVLEQVKPEPELV